MLKGKYIGIIGCGNMGEAIIKGILAKGVMPKSRIMISDIKKSRTVYIKHRYGVKVANNQEVTDKCNILILAVKPQDLNKAINDIAGNLSQRKILISILAGITIEKIKQASKKRIKIARVMPNMGALVGEAISAVSFSRNMKDEHRRIVMKIFSSLGEAVVINEEYMDAVTAVSGSGPAYFFYLVEALIEGAKALGIEEEIARKLAIKTALGSAKLLSQMKQSPQMLRDKITSKGGTTEAALRVFKSKDWAKTVKDAVMAAAERSKELSGGRRCLY